MMQEVKAVEGRKRCLCFFCGDEISSLPTHMELQHLTLEDSTPIGLLEDVFFGFPLNFRECVVPQDGSGWTILHGSKFRTAKLHGQGAYTCERTRPFTCGNSDAGS